MKPLKLVHRLNLVFAVLGLISLIAAWVAGEQGRFLGLTQQHLFNDAIIFWLIAIWLALGVIAHQKME